MEHTIRLNEQNIIEIKIGSNIIVDDIKELNEKGQMMAVELKKAGLPVLFLSDCTNLKNINPVVLTQASKLFAGIIIDKSAGYGLSRLIASLGNLMAIFGGYRERFRIFLSREEAMAWLLSGKK